jgi:hypothetical protein
VRGQGWLRAQGIEKWLDLREKVLSGFLPDDEIGLAVKQVYNWIHGQPVLP